MTANDKKVFIHDLIYSVKDEILSKVEKMPEDWDGIQLRQYIADQFNNQVMHEIFKRDMKRFRDYKNDVLVNNL